jgi:predicted CoA-binding protein
LKLKKVNVFRYRNNLLGSLQTILKKQPETISIQLDEFETEIKDIFKDKEFEIDFCYRMRVGVKF